MNLSFLTAKASRGSDVAAVSAAAAMMVVSGAVHIHLWDIAYRHVATLGPLFLVQAIAAIAGAVVLATTRWVFVAIGSGLLMVGTVVGFVIAATVGIFGFKLPEVTGWADLALASELLSTAVLAAVVLRQLRPQPALAARPLD
jgi:hypothetical protein